MRKDAALITGGAGFIGSNLTKYLLRHGFFVRVFDNLFTGKKENLEDVADEIDFIEGDICDREAINDAMDGVDYVFHLAAIPSVQRSIDDPVTTNKINIEGTLNVLVAAKEKGVKRLVYASSSSVYGNSKTIIREESQPVSPASPYALSKYAGEKYCQLFYQIYGLETVCLRYFNVFGPGQDPTSQYAAVVPKFIYQLKSGNSVTVYGDGSQTRDFTFVENVVEANLLAVSASGIGGEIFNVACGKRTTVVQLASYISEIMKREDVKIQYLSERKGEIKHSQGSILKAERMLGYRVKVDILEGLRRTVDYFQRRDG